MDDDDVGRGPKLMRDNVGEEIAKISRQKKRRPSGLHRIPLGPPRRRTCALRGLGALLSRAYFRGLRV